MNEISKCIYEYEITMTDDTKIPITKEQRINILKLMKVDKCAIVILKQQEFDLCLNYIRYIKRIKNIEEEQQKQKEFIDKYGDFAKEMLDKKNKT